VAWRSLRISPRKLRRTRRRRWRTLFWRHALEPLLSDGGRMPTLVCRRQARYGFFNVL
jgi:hypothetical protein